MYKCINGWTKKRMSARIRTKMLDHRAYDEEIGKCVYKASDGNHCAVGCFIPEDHRGMAYPGGVDGLLEYNQDLRPLMPLPVEALHKMQKVHDDVKNGDPRPALLEWIKQNVEE